MAAPDLKPIEGKYEILEKLNEGGMGAVYKVQHRLLEEVRVIKVIRPQLQSDENLRRRFLREARAAVRLRHPNIAHLYDFTVADDGTAYMVIEFIEGVDLVHVIQQGSLPDIGLIVDIGVQSLKALAYLHAKQFVHRDISPDNLMLTKDVEGQPLIKLIDLGIAKPLQSELSLTGEGLFLGKIRYASPEQFGGPSGEETIDHRSDLYSFGIVLYELLTGTHPITGDDNQTILAGHLFHPPRAFSETDPKQRVPDELRSITLKALEKSADDRFQDALEFSKALHDFGHNWVGSGDSQPNLDATMIGKDLAMPPRRPGSTQERLDREFSPQPTPTPRHLEAVPKDDRVEKESRIQAYCEKVEELISEKRLLDAEVQLQQGEQREGSSILFADLRKRIDELRERAAQEALRARLLLRDGSLDDALEKIDTARQIDSENPEIASLLDDIKKSIHNRDLKIEKARQSIEAELESGLLEEARKKIAKAAEDFGGSSHFADLENRVESLVASAERVRTIAEEAHKVGELIERRELHQASAALSAAIRTLGEDEMFTELAEQIEEVEKRQREEKELDREAERRRELKSQLQLAEKLAESDTFDEALKQLERAAEIDPDHPELAALRTRIESGQREKQALALLDQAYTHFESGRLDEAAELANQALATSPGLARATKLQRKILERRREEDRLQEVEERKRPSARLLETIPRSILIGSGVLILLVVALVTYLSRQVTQASPDVVETETFQQSTETLGELLAGRDLGKFYALVIGNNTYSNGLPNLDTAINDASQLAALLESRYGFETNLILDASRYETLSALEDYIDRLTPNDNLLVFYAGHGFVDEVTGRGYWQPTDAEPDNTSNWISSLEVSDILLDVPARRALVVADSCFSGAFADPSASSADTFPDNTTPQQIVERLDLRSRLVLASGNQLPIVDNGGDGHSVFSRALLSTLEGTSGAVDTSRLFEQLQDQVSNATIGKDLPQHPQFAPLDSDEDGVFVFVTSVIGTSEDP